jgi:hypothetical protein
VQDPNFKIKEKDSREMSALLKKGDFNARKVLKFDDQSNQKLNDESELNSGPNFFVESHYSYPRKKYRINTRDQVKSNPKFSNKKLDITTSEENPKNLYFSRNFIDVKDFQVKRPEFYDREPVGAKKSANKMLLEMQLRKIGPIEDSDRKGAGSYIQTDDFIERSDNGHTADKTQRESFKYCIRPS